MNLRSALLGGFLAVSVGVLAQSPSPPPLRSGDAAEPQAGAAVVASFRPADPQAPSPQEPDADEYAVYAAFFRPEADAAGDAARGAAWQMNTQFLGDARRARVLHATTLAVAPAHADRPGTDTPAEQAWADWRKRSARKAILSERIAVPGMRMLSDAEFAALRSLHPLSPHPRRRDDPREARVAVSRVGFDRERRLAAFEVKWSGGLMGASYRVLMRRAARGWVIDDVGMIDLWYH